VPITTVPGETTCLPDATMVSSKMAHHRRLLTEIGLLLVRRTRARIPPQTLKYSWVLYDLGTKRLSDAEGAGRNF
jgi:hypothetical protein